MKTFFIMYFNFTIIFFDHRYSALNVSFRALSNSYIKLLFYSYFLFDYFLIFLVYSNVTVKYSR